MEHEQFPVYQQALSVAETITHLCNRVTNREYYFIKDQVLRASASIVLNIAEGAGKWSKKDKLNYYRISRGSAYECRAAIDLMVTYRLVDEQKATNVKDELYGVYQGLNNLMSSIEKRKA